MERPLFLAGVTVLVAATTVSLLLSSSIPMRYYEEASIAQADAAKMYATDCDATTTFHSMHLTIERHKVCALALATSERRVATSALYNMAIDGYTWVTVFVEAVVLGLFYDTAFRFMVIGMAAFAVALAVPRIQDRIQRVAVGDPHYHLRKDMSGSV